MPAVVHALLGKSLNVVLLLVSMVNVLPQSVCSVNWFWLALTLSTVPFRNPNRGLGVIIGGSSPTVMPLVTPRFTERSDWMIVFRWKSTSKPRGEFAEMVTGKGADVRLTVAELSSIVGVSWHTLPTAQVLAIDESEALKMTSSGLANVRLNPE
jgi:hypothetical protein